MAEQQEGNIKQEYNNAVSGLNMDNTPSQIQKGQLSYALNASVENFDNNSINYQNELGNEFCLKFPEGYVLIGEHFIIEKNKHIFFITNPSDRNSQIGYMDNNDCVYRVLVNAPCLNFNINHPIHKIVHRITNCSTEIYWTDGVNPRRYLDIDDIPKILRSGSPLCSPEYTDDLDCNQLKLQPNFNIPNINVIDVVSGGNLISGTYQFAVQYSDPSGNPFTSYYSVTNPTPIADEFVTTVNFNYPVGKSIVVNIDNLDTSGQFEYFNLAVIKTINAISTPQLVGTYFIDNYSKQITYTGQFTIDLAIEDIFEKFPYYEIAQDLTAVQDVLVWDQLTSIDRINYQQIANKITLQWETWRIPPTENYADEINATNLRGYLRDEVYPFEIVFLLKNGKQTDGFHIPGRQLTAIENTLPRIPSTDPDFIGEPDPSTNDSPYWKIYNTATVNGFAPEYSTVDSYKGPYQFGEFAYWESVEEYPCNTDVWGELAGQKIRHHKFPDVNISPIYESKTFTSSDTMVMGNDAVFPIGVKIDVQQIISLIESSTLSREEKEDIVGFKIVRGDRSVNKSIVAKGMLRNVGEYKRDEQSFYFPNYPYNDLNEDPFLTTTNNAYQEECKAFDINITQLGADPISGNPLTRIQYYDCTNGKVRYEDYTSIQTVRLCSVGKPVVNVGYADIGYADYDVYVLDSGLLSNWEAQWDDRYIGITEQTIGGSKVTVEVVAGTFPVCIDSCNDIQIQLVNQVRTNTNCGGTTLLNAFTDDNKYRQIFNSPETSFGQPFLGDTLKLESVMFGTGKAHFVEVKDNAKYKLITETAQRAALTSSAELGAITTPFNATAMMTAYQAYLQIYINGITRKNYAYSFNSIGDYNYGVGVPDQQGIKQRSLNIVRYLIPGVQAVNDDKPINNWNRESSVFLKTAPDRTSLPYPDRSPNMLSGTSSIVSDRSRFTISEINNCGTPAKEEPINVVAYYASIKNNIVNQWGQIYSYETIDTGYQYIFNSPNPTTTVFGGDTFINRFAYKTKLPFFIDNRVNAPDDSDIFYDEIGNIAYPRYWHSARSILKSYSIPKQGVMANIISYKAHNFDCPNEVSTEIIVDTTSSSSSTTTTTSTTGNGSITAGTTASYYDGYFYLFAYGVPNFYCETSYNVDLRQAFNNREGDFWPHVSTDIPDDWVQENFVSIANDNTYYYNTTYSKQNRENNFTHLPPDWESKLCFTNYPFRAIYSDVQNTDADNRINNWLIYRAVSYFDFPQNYGNLVSLDGIQNRAVLARFENKTLMYNNLLTIDTSNPQAAYIGNPTLFKGAPPIDFAETDLGYIGSQHKMLLRIPQGQISVDAKRGQVFLIQGTQAIDMSGAGSGMNRFFVEHLPFLINKSFPEINIDNHFKDIGLHGVYDAVYDRVILTKLDYAPNPEYADKIKYDNTTKEFYIEYEVEEAEVVPTSSTTSTSTSSTTSSTTSTTSSTSSSTTTTSSSSTSTSTSTSSTSTSTTTSVPSTTTTSTTTAGSFLTIEQFGGEAYYKRFDDGLNYTSLNNGTTRITYTGVDDVFDSNDLNKSFCGLFANKNPQLPNPSNVNEYYPNIEGSRYCKVITVENSKNIIVDFEFNLNKTDWSGYIFFDNSDAFSDLMDAMIAGPVGEVRFQPLKTYVIPEFTMKNLPTTHDIKIWTGTNQRSNLKIGYEDYHQWGLSSVPRLVKQSGYLFNLTVSNRNYISHNINWTPPHRTVQETQIFGRTMFGGVNIGLQNRIIATINNNQLVESEEIGLGNTRGNFISMALAFAYSGGQYSGSGILEDTVDYMYFLSANVKHRGVTYPQFKANSGGGLYFVAENLLTESQDSDLVAPTYFQGTVRLTADKTGFASDIVSRTYYPSHVFEITSDNSWYQIANIYSNLGWANSGNLVQIGGFVFWQPVTTFWNTLYEQWYSRGNTKRNWVLSQEGAENVTHRKMMIHSIPRAGFTYTVGRSYSTSGNAVGAYRPDRMRGNINWSAVLNKRWDLINSATEIPANSIPLEFQPGDRFTIVGQGSTVYTVVKTDRLEFPNFVDEPKLWGNPSNMTYYACEYYLDQNLPSGLGLTFEINIIESKAEVLFDGNPRPMKAAYKSNVGLTAFGIVDGIYQIGSHDQNTDFADTNIIASENFGHASYNHAEITMWAKNYNHQGSYRQSFNSYPTPYTIVNPDTGGSLTVGPLRKYSKGYTIINSSGFVNQFNPSAQFETRDIIRKSQGIYLPDSAKEKVRLYNCVNMQPIDSVISPYIERYLSDAGAPDMPAVCRNLLNSLP